MVHFLLLMPVATAGSYGMHAPANQTTDVLAEPEQGEVLPEPDGRRLT